MSGADPTRLYVLTGASRGMGAAMARQLLQPGHTLLCLSRRVDDTLAAEAKSRGVGCEQWPVDLADSTGAAGRVEGWLARFDPAAVRDATLINNAAALTRIGPLDQCSATELASAVRVGLEAPLVLTAAFLRATRDWPVGKRVLNISSGLGRRAMAAQAPYCGAKAGLDHFSRCVALDEARQPHPARIVSLAPGVIDTGMQAQLRGADPAGFPERGVFVDLKASGRLASPDEAAARVLAFLERPDFGTEPVTEVRA